MPCQEFACGNGRLTAAGLTAELWTTRFRRVVQEQVRTRAEVWMRMQLVPNQGTTREGSSRPKPALQLWDGNPAILRELQAVPAPVPSRVEVRTAAMSHADSAELWKHVLPFRDRVPHFWIFLVSYPTLAFDPGCVSWGLRLQHQSCKRIFTLSKPTQLVIDVPHQRGLHRGSTL
jgi:hypothetical protein